MNYLSLSANCVSNINLQIIDGKLKTFPWVFPWLEKLGEEEIPAAVGTSSTRAAMNLALEKYNFNRWIKAFVCADDVKRGKPDPEIFLRAAEVLEIHPEKCVVFEDSILGIRAAKSAGMRVVGIATSHSPHELSRQTSSSAPLMNSPSPASQP